MLQEAYCAQCLLHYVAPELVVIRGTWLNQLLDEYRIADRAPNRKYKVSREVLAERLLIFWIMVAKIRKLCLLKWNYDPDCKNVDQSPFHVNEAGSREVGTLALKECPIVP